MVEKRRFPKVFPGWWITLAGSITSLWGHGYYIYGFSALFKPIASELGLSRAATSVPVSIGRLEGGIEAPLAGWVTDKYGPREIILSGVFLIGLSLILMNFIDSLWAFYVVWGVLLGTGCNIALAVPIATAISNWFVKKRGIALGIKDMADGLAGVLPLPLIAWLITTQGWRITCVIGGVVMWLIGLPLVWFFTKQHRPEYYGLLPDGVTGEEEAADTSQMIEKGIKYAIEVEEVEFTLRQAMRTPTYWLLIVVIACNSLTQTTIVVHSIPFLTDIEIDPLKAATMLTIMASAGIPARFGGAFLTDRVRIGQLRFLMVGAFLFGAVGIAVFLLNQTTTMIYVWFILCGIGLGIVNGAMYPIRARYFGRKALGSINGSAALFMTPIVIAAPIYAGWLYDTTGSYMTIFKLILAFLVVAMVLAFFILPPKPPAQITDIRKIV